GSPIRADGATKAKKKSETSADDEERGLQFAGLTKDELEQFAKDPFWHRLRLILFVLFWAVWLAMFALSLSSSCCHRGARRGRPAQFWQSPFYRVEVRSFAPDPAAPAVPSRAGSLAGLAGKRESSGCPLDFAAMDTSLGSLDQIRALTKRGRKKGFQLMMELDVSQADPAWKLPGAEGGSEEAFLRDSTKFDRMLSRDGQPAWSGGLLHTAAIGLQLAETSSARVRRALFDAMSAWLDAGLSGFSLTNAAFLMPKKTNMGKDNIPPAGSPAPSDWYRTDPGRLAQLPDGANFVRSAPPAPSSTPRPAGAVASSRSLSTWATWPTQSALPTCQPPPSALTPWCTPAWAGRCSPPHPRQTAAFEL
uniref:SLC3A2_N domain-containing protein n=1 Tax=Macrostomum lignano TaxID=282301 RepID=A0A1I8IZ73_9PLAT